ncbi:hypothetical protein Dimus_032305 [Dionaea muscipula]
MEQREILLPYELHYSDLVSLSSDAKSTSSSVSRDEIERLGAVSKSVVENLGPSGPGLIAVTGVPKASELRKSLLPLARDLALLDHDVRKRILKEHNLGSDVPLKNLDRCVSSFAMQLKYKHSQDSSGQTQRGVRRGNGIHNIVEESSRLSSISAAADDDEESKFKNLGSKLSELGFCMMDVGLCLARICDSAIGGHELEQSLLDSGTAKGRLIHYHSALDTLFIKESGRKKGFCIKFHDKKSDTELMCEDGSQGYSSVVCCDLWQQWHNDYGTFTVLTSPMFIKSCNQECPSPSGDSYLQIFDPNKKKICIVKAPPESSFVVQVGESADILSRGKLRATLHSVYRPLGLLENLSRETFVVFLQPAWNKVLDISSYDSSSDASRSTEQPQDTKEVTLEFHKIVPPLSSRLRNGMTFAEFSRETTKQYYGGSGLQSKR